MPNKHYQKGYRKECKLRKQFQEMNWIVLRTAQSRGFSDLIMIDRERKLIRFVQAKPNNFSQKERIRLEQEYAWLNDDFKVCFSVD